MTTGQRSDESEWAEEFRPLPDELDTAVVGDPGDRPTMLLVRKHNDRTRSDALPVDSPAALADVIVRLLRGGRLAATAWKGLFFQGALLKNGWACVPLYQKNK